MKVEPTSYVIKTMEIYKILFINPKCAGIMYRWEELLLGADKVTRVDLLLEIGRVLTVNSAANRESGAKHLEWWETTHYQFWFHTSLTVPVKVRAKDLGLMTRAAS